MADGTRITDPLLFWELARIPYNALVAGACASLLVPFFEYAGGSDVASRIALFPEMLWLAIVVNMAYCAVYPIDAFLGLRRWIIWTVAAALAAALAHQVTSMLIGGAIM